MLCQFDAQHSAARQIAISTLTISDNRRLKKQEQALQGRAAAGNGVAQDVGPYIQEAKQSRKQWLQVRCLAESECMSSSSLWGPL